MDLNKYNRPVPRYTSYPPANHFTGDFTGSDYSGLIAESNHKEPSHVAIYIHIPYCRQMCHYCGCNSCRLDDERRVRQYVDAVRAEISKVCSLLDRSRKVSQIHFGGGTPNAVDSGYISGIIGLVSGMFGFIDHPEIAVECNPAYLDRQYLQELRDAGVNRYSLGIQDFNLQVLRGVNRLPSAMPVGEIIDFIREEGKASVNLDFIYGLPLQTPETFSETIGDAIALRPDRLVTFSYAHVPWVKRNQAILEKRGLPSPERKMAMFEKAFTMLIDAGYVPVGLDHFVLPGDELNLALQNNTLHRNFQGYCTRRTTGQVYAFGVSAISQLAGGYAQNTKDIGRYIKHIAGGRLATEKGYILSGTEMTVREIITRLMCNYYLNMEELAATMQADVQSVRQLADTCRLDEYAADGLLEFDDREVKVTEKGKFFIRNIASAFDPAYKPEENKYSRPV